MTPEPLDQSAGALPEEVVAILNGDPPPLDEETVEELIMHLERDQLVAETFRPVPRAQLGARVVFGLWALRIFAVLVSVMVIYTFVARLH